MAIYNHNSNTLFSGSLGNDDMVNFADNNVTIDAGEGKNTVKDYGKRNLIIGGGDDDYIYNSGGYDTIFAGGGNDLLDNYGAYSLIYCESGNDTVDNKSIGDHSTIVGGAGDDLLKIYDYNDNNVIQYAEGDGNDVVINTGVSTRFDATLSITKGSYSQFIDGNDLLVTVGDGSIRFKDMANTKVNIEGTAGTSTPTILTPVTESTTTTTTVQTTTTTVQTTTATTQTTTPTSTPTIINNYYGDYNDFSGNNGTVVVSSNVEGGVGNTVIINKEGNTYTYNEGDKVINNYQEGEVVRLDDYQGLDDISGNNFYIKSSSGRLEIQNMRDKFIGYSAGDDNVIAYSYVASGGGNVDGRGKDQAEILIGADNQNNQIFAGNGGSSLWVANGGADTLTGGDGYDEFFYAMGSGNDVITNAGDNDVVNLLGVSLSQITYAEVSYSNIDIGFTDGGKLQLQGQAATGFRVEGVTYTADRSTGGWSTK